MTDFDPTDEDIQRMANKFGAPVPREMSRRITGAVRYEAIMGGLKKWHVIRDRGAERSFIKTCPSQVAADTLIDRLKEADVEAIGVDSEVMAA